MKKVVAVIMTMALSLAMFAGCAAPAAPQASAAPEQTAAASTAPAAPAEDSGAKDKTLGICIPLNAEYFGFIASQIKAKMDEMGVKTEILSAEQDGQLMITQIQNFTVKKIDALYIFPAGDASSFHDVVKAATDAGIKTVVSHNSTGEGTTTATIRCDELQMGMMMSAMTNKWIEANYPDAAHGSVKILVLENSLIPDMIKRSTGMKMIAEKFLRKIDMTTARYVKTDGNPATYLDKDGKEVKVEEPTGGLILDDKGHAILNPHYNPKAKIVECNNRTIGQNIDAQNAMDVVFTENNGANKDIKIVCCYAGDAAVGASEKLLSMIQNKIIDTDPSKLAVFGADITPDNVNRIKQSVDNTSLIRGIMTNGDIVGSIVNTIAAIMEGKEVEVDRWEPIGYMTLNADKTDVKQVLNDGTLPTSDKFLGN